MGLPIEVSVARRPRNQSALGRLGGVAGRELHQGISAMSVVPALADPVLDDPGRWPLAVGEFSTAIAAMVDKHRPSRMPFFKHLAALPRSRAADPAFLGRIHLNYQAAMHATRAAVYFLPHLDSPELRKRKLQILIDDDGLPGGDTHHYQLTRVFRNIGARCLLDDEEFGEPALLGHRLDGETADFVRLAPILYARSLGPWCVVEMLSADWMRALAAALAVHFPAVKDEPYFADCFSLMVEERHGAEALDVTRAVLAARPELAAESLRDAALMAEALDAVWVHLDRIVQGAGALVCQDAAPG
jgi:hypothetical protein